MKYTRERCNDGEVLWRKIDIAILQGDAEEIYQAVRAYFRHVHECPGCEPKVKRGKR